MTEMERPTAAEAAARYGEMVRAIAKSIAVELGVLSDLDDLIGFGFEGLMLAVERYDPARGVPFEAYAYCRVRGAVWDGVRRIARFSRRTVEHCERLAAAGEAVEAAGVEQRANPEQPADPDSYAAVINEMLGQLTASVVATAAAAEEQRSNPEEAFFSEFDRARVRQAVSRLTDREQRTIRGLYFEHLTLKDLATEFKTSESRVSQIRLRALAMLRASLE